MALYDVVSILSTFWLGIFTKSMTDDSTAIAQCRIDLLDLEGILESWQITDSSRSVGYDVDNLKKSKKILCLLKIHYAGLFVGYSRLEKFIDQSLDRIRRWEIDRNAPQNYPSFVGLDLIEKWKNFKNDMWNYVNANFVKRAVIRIMFKIYNK